MLKISLLFIQTLRVNNSRILTIKNAKFSEYYVYMNLNIWENFQICISVPLTSMTTFKYNDVTKKSRDLDYYVGIFGKILCNTALMQSFIARA